MADLLSTPSEVATWAALEQDQADIARLTYRSWSRLLEQYDRAVRKVGAAGAEKYLALDLAGTLRQGQGKGLGRLRDAVRLREVLTRTWDGLGAGTVWVDQVVVMLWELKHCSAAVAAEVERRVFAAGGQVECPSDLRRRVRHDVLVVEAELEPGATGAREKDAFEGRAVVRSPQPDGMSGLWVLQSAEQAVLFDAGLDELVRQETAADEAAGVERTAAQRRADVLASLPGRLLVAQARAAAAEAEKQAALALLRGESPPGRGTGAAPGSSPAPGADPDPAGPAAAGAAPFPGCDCGDAIDVTAIVNVHVPMATALGLSNEPGYLEGYGPTSAAHVRRLLPNARLREVAVDERTGRPIDVAARTSPPCGSHEKVRERLLGVLAALSEHGWLVDDTPEPNYRPSARLSRRIKVRDMRCSGPGCGQAACSCDDEHLKPHAQGGETSEANTGPVSRRCHNAKTHGGWAYLPHEDGSCTWTSPLGRSYTRPAFWRPPPELGVSPTLRPPDDPGLIGFASPRGPTPPAESEQHRAENPDEQPDQPRRRPQPPRNGNPYALDAGSDDDDARPDDDCPF